MEIECFENLVKETWDKESPFSGPIDRWQFKMRSLRENNKRMECQLGC
jgi:hypothetical protein